MKKVKFGRSWYGKFFKVGLLNVVFTVQFLFASERSSREFLDSKANFDDRCRRGLKKVTTDADSLCFVVRSYKNYFLDSKVINKTLEEIWYLA